MTLLYFNAVNVSSYFIQNCLIGSVMSIVIAFFIKSKPTANN